MSVLLDVNSGRLDTLDRMMSGRINRQDPGAALAVSYKSEIGFSRACGMADLANSCPLTVHSALDAGSIMKTLTGLALAMLEEEGVISETMQLRDVLPEFPTYGDDLRLKHLIHHESGLRNYTVLLYYMAGWHEQSPPSSDQVFETICRAGSLSYSPGARYEYCDSNYLLLARVIERVTGERLGKFVERRILTPLGMEDSAILDHKNLMATSDWAEGYVGYPSELRSPHEYRSSDSHGGFYPARLAYSHVGAEGLRTSVCDLLTLGSHLVGPSNVLTSSVRERMRHTSRVGEGGFCYGYGLNVGTFRGMRYYGHSGEIQGFTATLACFPEQRLQIACMTNRQDLGAWTCRDWALEELREKGPASRKSAEIRDNVCIGLQHMAGFYLNPRSACFLELSCSDNGAMISFNDEPAQPLFDRDPWRTEAGTEIIRKDDEINGGRAHLIIQDGAVASEYVPFDRDLGPTDFKEYEGAYECAALDSLFDVRATNCGLRLTNRNHKHPAMDLDYTPTIRDFFWSHDPHPELSQLQFLRSSAAIISFIYRDYDGDQREDFRFIRRPEYRAA